MKRVQVPATLANRITIKGECWVWNLRLHRDGYGRIGVNRVTKWAHRYMYELLEGPIPKGLQIDHLCRNRACVNPNHLEPVTQRENILRGEGGAAANAVKTHCVHGHEFTPENTYLYRGRGGRIWRNCRICMVAAKRRGHAG